MNKEELQEYAKQVISDLKDDLYDNASIEYDELDGVAKEVLEMAITILKKKC